MQVLLWDMHSYPARPQLPDTHKKMTTPDRITVHLQDISAHADIAGMWGEFETKCEVSFFQSWGWIGAWLQSMPVTTRLRCIIAETDGELTGLAILAGHWRNAISQEEYLQHFRQLDSSLYQHNRGSVPKYDTGEPGAQP